MGCAHLDGSRRGNRLIVCIHIRATPSVGHRAQAGSRIARQRDPEGVSLTRPSTVSGSGGRNWPLESEDQLDAILPRSQRSQFQVDDPRPHDRS